MYQHKMVGAMSTLRSVVGLNSSDSMVVPSRVPKRLPKKPKPKAKKAEPPVVDASRATSLGDDGLDALLLPGLPPTNDSVPQAGPVPLLIPYREEPSYCLNDITDDWSIARVVTEKKFKGWEKVFQTAQHDLLETSGLIEEDEKSWSTCLPHRRDIFKIFSMVQPPEIKVVILDQAPYPRMIGDHPEAVGMSYGGHPDNPVPASLKNIYKELARSIPGYRTPGHGDLTHWVLQGVFLLNMSLTVRINQPNSHSEVWMGFIIPVLEAIGQANPECVFMLWGGDAQKAVKYISSRSKVLACNHPSPRSVMMGGKECFIGCGHFVKCNEILVSQKKTPIDWQS